MSVIVDASVAAKWVLPELDAARAAALKSEPGGLIAPSLIVAEIGSAIWKMARKDELSPEDALRAFRTASGLVTRLVPLEELGQRAIEIAILLDHPIYDCFYLALAERERLPIVSADAKLLAAAKKLRTVEGRKL